MCNEVILVKITRGKSSKFERESLLLTKMKVIFVVKYSQNSEFLLSVVTFEAFEMVFSQRSKRKSLHNSFWYVKGEYFIQFNVLALFIAYKYRVC